MNDPFPKADGVKAEKDAEEHISESGGHQVSEAIRLKPV
jgi:hypothetical protein